MTKRKSKDMTVEEFDEWCAATDKFDKVADAADEVGGPRLSLVPLASLYRGASGLVTNLSRTQLDASASANANASADAQRR